jgi:hypothetical protein
MITLFHCSYITDVHRVSGGFELGQSASGDELKHWLLAMKSPEQWVEMWHKLKPNEYHS